MKKTRLKDWVLKEVESKVKERENAPYRKEAEAAAAGVQNDSDSENFDPMADSDHSSNVGSLDENGQEKLSDFDLIKKMMRIKARREADPNHDGAKIFTPKNQPLFVENGKDKYYFDIKSN